MLFHLISLTFIFSLEFHPPKTITKSGMTVSWHIRQDRIYFEMTAPTQGWLAIGLNSKKDLVGNNLIMGAVINGQLHIEDQYIQAVGVHKKITSLGGKDLLKDKTGSQTKNKTTIAFSLPLISNDKYHHNLKENESFYLLMAYASENDFQHHSRMRTTVQITL